MTTKSPKVSWKMEIIIWIFVLASAATNFAFCHAQDLPYAEICTNIEDLSVPREWDKFSTPELIEAQNYPSETHEVNTTDGYIVTLHRIPNSGGIPVFILHGILCTSRDFFMQRGNNSLAFVLHNAGYDVWLGNMRGNGYSMKHKTLRTDDPDFWDFAYDDIAQKDVPAMLDYMYDTTTMPSHCIGYSLGTTTIMAGLIRHSDPERLCRSFISLAPIVTLQHVLPSTLWTLARLENPEEPLKGTLYAVEPSGQFTPTVLNELIKTYLPSLCKAKYDRPGICQNTANAIMGSVDPQQVDNEMSSRIYSFFPSTTSVRTLIQVTRSAGRNLPFSEYKYQTNKQNLEAYHQINPPVYDLSKFKIPTYLIVGPNDKASTEEDTRSWSTKLGVTAEIKLIEKNLWSHLDFIWAKEACSYVYGPVLDRLKSLDDKSI